MAEEVPAAHGVVAFEPLTATNLPASASLHSLEPSSSAYSPKPHGLQAPAPAPLEVPGGHLEHVLAPMTALDSPASHGVHVDSPGKLYVPMGQFSQAPTPAPLYVPAGHLCENQPLR